MGDGNNMRRIAIINQKGGVGKTTTVANLGAALARAGKRVVVFDMDPQANLSLYLGSEVGRGDASVYGVLTEGLPVVEALRKTKVEGLSLVASHLDLSGAELELASAMSRETLLRDAINLWEAEAIEKDGFPPADYVLLDCPPSLGLLSINALVAAEEVMITVQTEFFALQGLSKLVEVIQLLRRRMNPALTLTGILPCLYDSRLKLAREVLAELRRFFPGKVYPTPVRTNVRLAESPSHGMTIFEYAPGSNGAKDYAAMGEELLKRSPTEERPKPTSVEVVNDEQAKELRRAAEGLRDLEAPAPDHWVATPENEAKVPDSAPDITSALDAPPENNLVAPDGSAPKSEECVVENSGPAPGPKEPTSAVRADDGVDAELATYELPRINPDAPIAPLESPQSPNTVAQASPIGATPKEELTPVDNVEDSEQEVPHSDAEPRNLGLQPDPTSGETEVLVVAAPVAVAPQEPNVKQTPSAEAESAPVEEPRTPEPEVTSLPPTPVMGFGTYIGEDRWTRKPQQNREG
ncbi:MAG: chromosome partitioning protein [Planctomycetota bacterium]|jgi:chromosome partitioning protein